MRYEEVHLKERFAFLGENGCDPVVQMYLPDNLVSMNRQDWKRPCMVVCPGGAYCYTSDREAEPIALHFLTQGFNVFVLRYSTAPHRFPTALREVAALMELIYENTDLWHCDPNRVAIMGFSAGGHLAAHYSNAFDCEAVRAVFPDSKPVNATVLGYPVIIVTPDTHRTSFKNLVGHFPETEEETAAFSCEKLVTDRTPPTFLWHTAEDQAVTVRNSLVYAEVLSRHGVPFELHVYPHGPHGMSTGDVHTNDNLTPETAAVKDWLPAVKKWLDMVFEIA